MLRTVVAVAAASLSLAVVVRGQAACTNACSYTDDQGNVYDFSSLQGQELTTTDPSDTYYMNICGESSTTCPNDPSIPPVTSGMVVESAAAGGCWVLGVSVSPRPLPPTSLHCTTRTYTYSHSLFLR